MAEADIKMIVELTGCSFEKAEETLHETGSVDAALDVLIEAPKPKYQLPTRPKKELDAVQQHLAEMRAVLEKMDRDRESTSASRHGYAGQVERIDPHAETVPQSNCSPECQQPSQG